MVRNLGGEAIEVIDTEASVHGKSGGNGLPSKSSCMHVLWPQGVKVQPRLDEEDITTNTNVHNSILGQFALVSLIGAETRDCGVG